MKISPKTWHWYLNNSGKGNHFWLGNCKLTKNDLFCSYFSKILPIFEWELTRIWKSLTKDTAWKVSKYRVSSGPYFPIFGLNTKIYSVNLLIQSAYRKIETRKKFRFWILFTQWEFHQTYKKNILLTLNFVSEANTM